MIREKIADFIPKWLRQTHAYRYLYTFGLVADASIEICLQAMAARFPGFGTSEALARIARDRLIFRGPFESDEAFGDRLTSWFADGRGHHVRGNAAALLYQVRGWCSPYTPRLRYIVPNNGGGFVTWWTLSTDGTLTKEIKAIPLASWDWDGSTTLNTRSWLVIYNTAPNQLWNDDGVWIDGPTTELWEDDTPFTWGTQATIDQIHSLIDLIRVWKSGHTRCVEIIIAFDDDDFDPLTAAPPNPDGTWGNYSVNNGGVQGPTRIDNAAYWLGTG